MSFWSGLSKLIQGKPVFEVPSEGASNENVSGVRKSELIDGSGRKVTPQLRVEHCKSYVNGDTMQTMAWLVNNSAYAVKVDKVVLMGSTTHVDRHLDSGEGHQVQLYSGPVAASDHDHKASVYCTIVENGDYFRTDYMVEYNRESNGTYTVEELHAEPAVFDI